MNVYMGRISHTCTYIFQSVYYGERGETEAPPPHIMLNSYLPIYYLTMSKEVVSVNTPDLVHDKYSDYVFDRITKIL